MYKRFLRDGLSRQERFHRASRKFEDGAIGEVFVTITFRFLRLGIDADYYQRKLEQAAEQMMANSMCFAAEVWSWEELPQPATARKYVYSLERPGDAGAAQ